MDCLPLDDDCNIQHVMVTEKPSVQVTEIGVFNGRKYVLTFSGKDNFIYIEKVGKEVDPAPEILGD